ncbi:MAG TPA: hypothetical protein VFJ77_03610 [Gaiellaceae bacterium]|nr:hypothetical protein [Gaiellaceae bacterium]
MRALRALPLLAALALLGVAHASAAAVTAPRGLHGFLLRADEPHATSFNRTPSFAWSPVPGAARYQFQLATSSTFRDNGVLYDNSRLLTPVEAPPLTLPWITGSPHALYARARALFADGSASPWSAAFGFDVVPPAPPTPLASYPGVLRWTPVEGADAYQVWLLDARKQETVRTNVLDEREFYTFHQAAQWSGTVRWRVRALRDDTFNHRINGLPAARAGAWSPIYSSTNPAPTGGAISLVGTVSDVFSNGSAGSKAHELMPAFLWKGNQGLSGDAAELFRVYVFTDRQCLNPVYTSVVTGAPAYAPRLGGPLSLPVWTEDVPDARALYLGDAKETSDYAYDGGRVTPNEQLASAKPTVAVPGDVPAAEGTTPPPDSTGSPSGSGSSGSDSGSDDSSAPASGQNAGGVDVAGDPGPPVDLWDVDWPQAGYYWTVVPVEAVGADPAFVGAHGVAKGDTVVPVDATQAFDVGDSVKIGVPPSTDNGTVISIGANTITLSSPLTHDHAAGEPISRAIRYTDMELPQDVCAAGRVQRFGISSEPSLTTAQAPFVTGLSSGGRLISATRTKAFYGQPLVAWTPAFNASVYQVQWSKKRYPFTPQADPRTNVKGFLTFSTSAVLPLTAGTWWYRVRGFDFNLPTGVQQMSWSDPQKLVVSAPKFTVKATKRKPKRFKVVSGKP